MKIDRELLYERLYDDADTWEEFVGEWIEREQLDTFEIVDTALNKRLKDGNQLLNKWFSDFVENKTQRQLDAYADDKYQEWKDNRITEPGGEDGRTETEGS